jgi:hypothetical protein
VTAGDVTSGALTATTIGTGEPGNAFSTRSNVFTIGIDGGRSVMLGNFVFRLRAGIVSAKSAPAESATEIPGRRITGRRIAPHTRDSPVDALMRDRNGMRPLSMLVPRRCIRAGRTESEPTMATATTIIVPIPIDLNVGSPTTIIPATAISTVTPEMRTAWQEVRAVRSSASCGVWPRCRSSRSRLR